jgi:Carboxypeptidase regulatory-like domain/TonB-dependent Receptor Plug Domain
MKSTAWVLALCLVVVAVALPVFAQESAVRGNLAGVVLDKSGAVVPDAKVTITGPTGTRTETSGQDGRFLFGTLNPGVYSVKVEKQGFKVAQVSNVEVATGRTSALRLEMAPGVVSETVEVTADAVTVDTASTAVSTNLSDNFYTRVPVQRNVSSLFYAAPGVASGGASGAANPSISGGSGLENQYIADGVNITDAAFGGLGVFSRSYGSLATGINLSFVKEVQVKTAGYEPQYGKSTGGIVQIVTKSGGNEYHGGISAFAAPKGLESTHLNPDDPQFGRQNLFGTLQHTAAYDAAFEFGGPVPGLKDRLFFFGSYNPSESERLLRAPVNSGLFPHGDFNLRTFTNNYAGKLTLKLSDKHTLEGSVFGDPSHTSTGPNRRLRMDNTTALSKLDFGTRNIALHLNSTLSPTWLLNISGTWGRTTFNEGSFPNLNEIQDELQSGVNAFPAGSGADGIAPDTSVQRGIFIPVGLGFVEPTVSNTYTTTFDTQKVVHALGEHTFYVGYHMERPFYDGSRTYSGPTYTIPSLNASGNNTGLTGVSDIAGQQANMFFRLLLAPAGCTLCPLMSVPGFNQPVPVLLRSFRSEFALNDGAFKSFNTSGRYHAAYASDSWAIGRHLTVNAGLRWEQQRLTGEAASYTFTDNWSPRVGFSFDPMGNRKTKIFGNFGRYTYGIPLDMAERALTNEQDFAGLRVAPAFTVVNGQRVVQLNQFGTVTPVVDPAHVLNGATGGVSNSLLASGVSTTAIAPGTRMSYLDEYVFGVEHEFPFGIVGSVKYVKRDLKRIVEDTGGISPEAALAGITQVFQIANVGAGTDLFTNPIGHVYPVGSKAPCDTVNGFDNPQVTNNFGDTVGAICFDPTGVNGGVPGDAVPDGIPDGFTNARRTYWAVESELNKAFSKGWMMRVNYRFARLYGNFEGALRNDNGQTDPSISSLFDFTPGVFGLLGDQFRAGPLNTDVKHILNTYLSYAFTNGMLKNLALGTGIRYQSGTPINDLKAHPVYENAGEVPNGGRGALGRTPNLTQVDFHTDYTIPTTEKTRVVIGADLFNLFNRKTQIGFDQNEDVAFGTANSDFLKPLNVTRLGDAFQQPFNARFSLKFVF